MTDEVTQLQQALQQLKEEYDAFAYIVSHDLGAPFRHISGFAQLIAKKHGAEFDEKSKEHLDFIIESSQKGSKLIERLLQYSRLNTESQSFKSVDLNRLVSEVITKLSLRLNVREEQISYPDLPTVLGEEKQLKQLFIELIHNAMLYQHKNAEPQIIIRVDKLEGYWQFTIQDNGIGVQEGVEDKIFEVLRRGVKDSDYPGEGMGLAFARNIIYRHQGKIWLGTSDKQGAVFHFTIKKN